MKSKIHEIQKNNYKSLSKKLYTLFLLATSAAFAQGSLCENPIVIGSLPYTTTDDTANYLDSYDPSTASSPFCSLTVYGNQYHGGNDVIYSYTATFTGAINVQIPAAIAWTGMFMYNNCADIGVSYAACATGPSAGARNISNFPVTAGQTYFIYISSWPTPQTVTYTLNVTDASLAVDNFETSRGIVVYPNPATDVLRVKAKAPIKSTAIYNVNGQQLRADLSADNEIAIGHLQSGFYILELNTDEGKILKNFVKS